MVLRCVYSPKVQKCSTFSALSAWKVLHFCLLPDLDGAALLQRCPLSPGVLPGGAEVLLGGHAVFLFKGAEKVVVAP